MRPVLSGQAAKTVAAKALVTEAGGLPPAALTVEHAARTYAAIHISSYAPATRYAALSALRSLLDSLVANGAPFGLSRSVPHVTRPAPRSMTITEDELASLLQLASPAMRFLLFLCHDCALRSGTAVRVTWRDVQNNELVTRTKGDQVIRLPLSERLQSLLQLCPLGHAPLCSLLAGRPISQLTAHREFKALLASVGLPTNLRLHDLRRTMAEKTYNLTSDLRVVQLLLGHTNASTTLGYLQRPAARHMPALRAAMAVINGG